MKQQWNSMNHLKMPLLDLDILSAVFSGLHRSLKEINIFITYVVLIIYFFYNFKRSCEKMHRKGW
jgi:hypothetical protein